MAKSTRAGSTPTASAKPKPATKKPKPATKLRGLEPRKRKAKGPNPELAPLGAAPDDSDNEQKRRQFLSGLGKLEPLIQAVKDQRKVMKEQGFTAAEISDGLWARKAETPVILARQAARAKILRWLSIPLGTQADLFKAPEVVNRNPFEEGKASGLLGETLPAGQELMGGKYEPSSPEGQLFMGGHHQGQQQLAKGIKKLEGEDKGLPLGRGMPGGAGAGTKPVTVDEVYEDKRGLPH